MANTQLPPGGPTTEGLPLATTRRLGRSDLVVGRIAFGCWRFAGTTIATAQAKLETALDAGMTLVDTADIYGFDGDAGFGDAEWLLGQVLDAAPHLRDRMVLATKGGIRPPVPYDQGADYLVWACEASLRRLKVDHVDLYQVHRPDLLTHPAELAATLDGLVERGLTRHVGVSNFTVAQTEALMAHLRNPLVTTQPQFSPVHLDPLTDGTLDLCMRGDLAPLAWSPLGGGRLAADPPADPRAARVVEVLDRLAEREGVARPTVALAWLLAHPAGVVPIIGTQRSERIRELAAAVTVRLDRTDWYRVLTAARGERLP
jgi:predicted oxidoreductase